MTLHYVAKPHHMMDFVGGVASIGVANLAPSEARAFTINTKGGDKDDVLSKSWVSKEIVEEDIIYL